MDQAEVPADTRATATWWPLAPKIYPKGGLAGRLQSFRAARQLTGLSADARSQGLPISCRSAEASNGFSNGRGGTERHPQASFGHSEFANAHVIGTFWHGLTEPDTGSEATHNLKPDRTAPSRLSALEWRRMMFDPVPTATNCSSLETHTLDTARFCRSFGPIPRGAQ